MVSFNPSIAPVLLGLNSSGVFLGVTSAGVLGAIGLHAVGAQNLGYVAIVPLLLGLVASEAASRQVRVAERAECSGRAMA